MFFPFFVCFTYFALFIFCSLFRYTPSPLLCIASLLFFETQPLLFFTLPVAQGRPRYIKLGIHKPDLDNEANYEGMLELTMITTAIMLLPLPYITSAPKIIIYN